MTHPVALLHCRERKLQAKDFFDGSYGRVYRMLATLFDEGFPIEETDLLIQELRNRFGLRLTQADERFAAILNAARSEALVKNAKWHAELVKRASEKRQILVAMVEAMGRFPTERDLRPMLQELQDQAAKVFRERMHQMRGFQDAVATIRDNPDEDFVETGIATFDANTGGFALGELIVIAAGENVGKSALGLTIALHAAEHGHGVLFANLEMDDKPLARRAISILSDVPARKIRDNTLSPEEAQQVTQAQRRIQAMRVQMISPDSIDLAGILSEIEQSQIADPELRLVVVDYVGLIKHPDKFMRPHEKSAAIADALKVTAKSKRIVIVALAQLNREGKSSKRPHKGHIADSDQWSRNADVVWVMHAKGEPQAGQQLMELIVDKNRNNEKADIEVYLDLPCSRIYEQYEDF